MKNTLLILMLSTLFISCGSYEKLNKEEKFALLYEAEILQKKEARNDMDEIMELLLEFGGDVTIKNNHQRSALNLATTLKSKKVLRVIENSGMDYSAIVGREKITHHRRFEEEY